LYVMSGSGNRTEPAPSRCEEKAVSRRPAVSGRVADRSLSSAKAEAPIPITRSRVFYMI